MNGGSRSYRPAFLPCPRRGSKCWSNREPGSSAGFLDDQYVSKGGRIVADRGELFRADILLQVRTYGANAQAGRADLQRLTAQSVRDRDL